jgi:hypothetical protein
MRFEVPPNQNLDLPLPYVRNAIKAVAREYPRYREAIPDAFDVTRALVRIPPAAASLDRIRRPVSSLLTLA